MSTSYYVLDPCARSGSRFRGSPPYLVVGLPLLFLFIVVAACYLYYFRRRKTKVGLAAKTALPTNVHGVDDMHLESRRNSDALSCRGHVPVREGRDMGSLPPAYAAASPPPYRES